MKINVRHPLSFSAAIFWQAAAFQQILMLEGGSLWIPNNVPKIPGTLHEKVLAPKEKDPKRPLHQELPWWPWWLW